MSLADTIRPTAARLLDAYGKTITFSSTTPGTYNTATGVTSTAETSDVEVKALVENFVAKSYDTDQIQRASLKVTIADITPAPGTADSFTVDGIAYTVVSVKPTFVNELTAIHEVLLARA